MFISYLALLSALSLSAVSGYFSVVGLTTLFAGAIWEVAVMASVLEVAKLVTASWLYRNWHLTSKIMKAYLSVCVFVLVIITSLGVFGLLSKAHIDQQLKSNTGTAEQIAVLQSKLDLETSKIKDVEEQINQIDNAINKLTEKGQASTSLNAVNSQRRNKVELIKQKTEINSQIAQIRIEKSKLESEQKKIEAEIGPLKYIAEMIYGEENAKTHFDSAVRLIIIILVIVFDPLAVILLIAANSSLYKKREPVLEPQYVPMTKEEHDMMTKLKKKINRETEKLKNLVDKKQKEVIINNDEEEGGDGWLSSSIKMVKVDPNDIAKM